MISTIRIIQPLVPYSKHRASYRARPELVTVSLVLPRVKFYIALTVP